MAINTWLKDDLIHKSNNVMLKINLDFLVDLDFFIKEDMTNPKDLYR